MDIHIAHVTGIFSSSMVAHTHLQIPPCSSVRISADDQVKLPQISMAHLPRGHLPKLEGVIDLFEAEINSFKELLCDVTQCTYLAEVPGSWRGVCIKNIQEEVRRVSQDTVSLERDGEKAERQQQQQKLEEKEKRRERMDESKEIRKGEGRKVSQDTVSLGHY